MTESFTLVAPGRLHAGNAGALAYASQLAYPGGRVINPDYINNEELELDIGKKEYQARQWGFEHFSYSYSQEKKILALIMSNSTDVVISFRGTVSNNFSNIITDIQLLQVPFGSFGKVHKGFRDALQSIWGEIKHHISFTEKRNVRLTGHSLGGALALLAGVRFVTEYSEGLVKEIYTFGQPRVGDRDFEQCFNKSYLNGRVFKLANYNDMVAVIPPHIKKIIDYVDVGHIVFFSKDGLCEIKRRLTEFRTVINFLTGYFHEYDLLKQKSEKRVYNWKSFRRLFKRKFSEKKESGSDSTSVKEDWEHFKQFFTMDLPKFPRRQRPQKVLQVVMELFVKLYIKMNPYGIKPHDINTYINNIKNNDINSLIPG